MQMLWANVLVHQIYLIVYVIIKKNLFGRIVNKKPIVANDDELKENSRAQSAKLRIFEKE